MGVCFLLFWASPPGVEPFLFSLFHVFVTDNHIPCHEGKEVQRHTHTSISVSDFITCYRALAGGSKSMDLKCKRKRIIRRNRHSQDNCLSRKSKIYYFFLFLKPVLSENPFFKGMVKGCFEGCQTLH